MASPMATCPSNQQQPIMRRKPRKARHPAPRLPQTTPPSTPKPTLRISPPLLAHAARDRGTCRRHRRRAPAQACGRGHGHLPARAPTAPDLALPENRHTIPRRPYKALLGVAPLHSATSPYPPLCPRRHHVQSHVLQGRREKAAQTVCKPRETVHPLPYPERRRRPTTQNPAATEVATGFPVSKGADSRSLPFSEAPAYAALRLAVATMVFTPLTASTTASTNNSTASSACTAGAKMSPPFMMSRVFW